MMKSLQEGGHARTKSSQDQPGVQVVFAAFRDWMRHRRLIRQCDARLAACDNDEIARIAHDVGLSSSDLRQMAKRGPDAAQQLLDRMAALHLDADAIAKNEPAAMRDMQRLCTNCVDKKRCQRDLVLSPERARSGTTTARTPTRSTNCKAKPRTTAKLR